MSDILDFYQHQAQQGISFIPWLAEIQSQAQTDFIQRGFPTRNDEEWKYTVLDGLLSQTFSSPEPEMQFPEALDTGVPVAQQLLIKNGLVHGVAELAKNLPQGVIVLPLAMAIVQHEELVKRYLNQIVQIEHGIHALNSAMIQSGVFIYVPEGVRIDTPFALVHIQDQNGQAVHTRNLIVAAPESEITVMEVYQGAAESTYFTNTLTELHLDAGAKVTHYKVQQESLAAYHLGHLFVRQSGYSELYSHSLSLGGKLVRSDINIRLQEEHAYCLMNGIYAPKDGQHVDHHTKVDHLVPNCRSEQDYKGILQGKSRAVFNGKVVVAVDAQHSDAKQQNKNLLLSKDTEIDTKPQLEIYADDVVCTHGATVGQLDEDALFYLATRGIDQQEAAHYLIHAFANDNLRLMSNQWLSDLVTSQVG